MEQSNVATLVAFFKVMAHESRLRIVGFLAEREYSVNELATLLGLKDPTVSHHLAKLEDLDLVTMRQDGTTHYYKLNTKTLERLNKDLLTPERVAALGEGSTRDFEAKVRQSFMDGERITAIPASFQKWLVLLRWLIDHFEMDRRYTEKEVNAIISVHHEDYALIRRDFIEQKFMARDHGIYWRLPAEVTEQHLDLLTKSGPVSR